MNNRTAMRKMCSNLVVIVRVSIFVFYAVTGCSGETNWDKYLQPDNALYFYQFNESTCTRECTSGSPSRICYYKFYLEDYAVLSNACPQCPMNLTQCYNPQCVTADGYPRGITTVNRRLPGPSIQVCSGDRIIVDVINQLPGKTTSIHWHGIYQNGTQYYDGVPMVTQCPIIESNSFRYDFFVKQPGTYFWHSHDGIQKVDGLQGPLVVRQPKELDPNNHLYDYDLPAHTVFVQDWFHEIADQHFPGILRPNFLLYDTFYLINGMGRYTHPITGRSTNAPYSVFKVTKGKRYRFRLIGGTCFICNVRLSMEGHNFTVIALDGYSIEPFVVNNFDVSSGERYDFVVHAVNEVKSYWIKVKALNSCQLTHPHQMAILQYEGSEQVEPTTSIAPKKDFNSYGPLLNPQNAKCRFPFPGVCVSSMKTLETFDPRILTLTPDVDFPIDFGYFRPTIQQEFQSGTYHRYYLPPLTVNFKFMIFHMNKIIYKEPVSPLLSQGSDIPESAFCVNDSNGFPTCDQDMCKCINILRVPLNSVVQIILTDQSPTGNTNHPFHLHGYAFSVIAMGYVDRSGATQNATVISHLLRNGTLKIPEKPILKDTIVIPPAGYAVIRIVADNPGYWFFHCHILFHHVAGMSMVVQVGDPSEFPSPPKGFPTCGNFLP